MTAFGTSTIYGGSGNDSINEAGGAQAVAINVGVAVETNDGNDQAFGGNFADTLTSSAGNDTLNGGNGNNIITTLAGNTSLNGGTGTDTITSGGGTDTLTGANGNDNMTGGGGNDQFVVGNSTSSAGAYGNLAGTAVQANTTITFANGVDVITDFVTGDQINSGINGAAATDLAAVANVNANTAAANYSARGTFAGNVFTFNAAGNDVVYLAGTGNSFFNNANAGYVVLQGYGAILGGNQIAQASFV